MTRVDCNVSTSCLDFKQSKVEWSIALSRIFMIEPRWETPDHGSAKGNS